MSLFSRLSVRIAFLLLAGFIALQLMVLLATAWPARGDGQRPYGLPKPFEVAAMADALDRAPTAQRPLLVAALDQGLYRVTLSREGVQPSINATTEDLVLLGRFYAAAMPRRAVAVDAPRPLLGALIGSRPRPVRFLAPVRISVSLADGSALTLSSRPSAAVSTFLRRRSIVGLVAGLVLLAVLLIALRQTMKPVARLTSGVRRFGEGLDAPDLPIEGPREVRELAGAFNDMKQRITALVAGRTRTLAAIAHDMRTYLTRLRLRADYIGNEDHRARAVRDLDEMSALLEDTLTLASLDAGSAGPEPAPVIDLRAIVAQAIAARGDARVTLEVSAEGLEARARPLSVRRIVDNLVDNGLRHGGHVSVTLARTGEGAVLIVSDDGPGVAPDDLAQLGEAFHRLDPSRSRDAGGAGLGLAIVRALALRDGARVSFANGGAGGLEVRLDYPRAD